MPRMRNRQICRGLSVHFLCRDFQNIHNGHYSTDELYYLIDPGNEFKRTSALFSGWMRIVPKWSGTSGAVPEMENFMQMLFEKDVYLFCGHGSGGKGLQRQKLQKLICHAAALLFGCASVGNSNPGGYFEAESNGLLRAMFLGGW